MADLDQDTVRLKEADDLEAFQLVIDAEGQYTALPRQGGVTIGRARECEIRLEDSSVSRKHAALRVAREGIEIRDLDSANGTRVRGAAVGEAWTRVEPGDPIQLGSAIAVVRRVSAVAPLRRVWPHGLFERRMEEECARSVRSGRPFALVRLNLRGDLSPDRMIELCAGALRVPDVLALYAPKQFEVLLVEATAEQAAAVVARLEARLKAAGLETRAAIACFPHDAQAAGDLLALANRMVRDGERAKDGQDGEVWGIEESEAMCKLRGLIEQVAPGNISVLILGETGVGKEVCAERIHLRSPRADKVFLRLNCAALSESLLESELFGHEKGSFTGAVAAKPGLIETADGGTVFLDEVGELPMSIQVKLLRVLDEKKVLRVGGLSPRPVDVRIVSATNRNLEAAMAAGTFRQDLYYRLAGVVLRIPPLRERPGEIAALTRQFAEHAARDLGMPQPPALSAAARAALERHGWPGNIRELRNAIERAVLLCRGGAIEEEHLPAFDLDAALRPTAVSLPFARRAEPDERSEWDEPMATSPGRESAQALREEMKNLEKQRILETLANCAGNQSEAARRLGIPRGTLISRLQEWGVARPRKRR